MAFNGAGVFTRIYSWVTDKANNVKITASRMDTEMDGFATGLSTCITKDGQTTITANLPMGGYKHTGVAAGTARTHYADVGSAQDGTYHWCGTAGGTANAITLTASPAITAYAAGQVFRFTAGASSNSGATTIAVSGLATKAVQIGNAALAGGEILAGKTYNALYDGTQFQLFGSLSAWLPDTDASHYLKLAAGSNLTAARTLTLTTGDSDRTLTISGNVTLSGSPVEQGIHEFYVPASAMIARTTNGAAAGTTETSTNDVMLKTLDFDQTTAEGAQFSVSMPKSWDEGTVTFLPYWTAASGTGDVMWSLAGVALSNDDLLDTAFGTVQTSTDTLIATTDLMLGPESSAITIAGTPAAGDLVFFQVARVPGDAADTLNADAQLIGVRIRYTISAGTDA